jgi:hypothetical protein
MTEPRYRKNSILRALMVLLSPKRDVRVNALHPRHPDGHFTFEVNVPIRDIQEYADGGELYAVQSPDWNWVGCAYNREWFRFISRQAYDCERKAWAEIDAGVKRNDPFPRELFESVPNPSANMQVVKCRACDKYFILVAPDHAGDMLFKRCQHCGKLNELEQVSPPGAEKPLFRAKRIIERVE